MITHNHNSDMTTSSNHHADPVQCSST